MNWIDFKKDKTSPKDNSWVLIQSSLKNTPKFEVCNYKNGEWYLPANDDSCDEGAIIKWAYLKE
jgi:hypothetical protein